MRMLPTEQQAAALGATLGMCNAAASWLSTAMHAVRVHRKHDVQKRVLRRAQGAVWALGAARDPSDWQGRRRLCRRCRPTSKLATTAHPGPRNARRSRRSPSDSGPMPRSRSMRGVCRGRSPTRCVGVKRRCPSGRLPGRCKGVRILAAPHDLVMLRTRQIGETDLVCRDGKWFLYASVEAPEASLTQPAGTGSSAWIWE